MIKETWHMDCFILLSTQLLGPLNKRRGSFPRDSGTLLAVHFDRSFLTRNLVARPRFSARQPLNPFPPTNLTDHNLPCPALFYSPSQESGPIKSPVLIFCLCLREIVDETFRVPPSFN
jgi:hypothetical protein